MGEQRPNRARVLIGQRDRGNVRMSSVQQARKPHVGVHRLSLRRQDGRARAVNQQCAQVHIAALADAQQRWLASARMLPGTKPSQAESCRPLSKLFASAIRHGGRFAKNPTI